MTTNCAVFNKASIRVTIPPPQLNSDLFYNTSASDDTFDDEDSWFDPEPLDYKMYVHDMVVKAYKAVSAATSMVDRVLAVTILFDFINNNFDFICSEEFDTTKNRNFIRTIWEKCFEFQTIAPTSNFVESEKGTYNRFWKTITITENLCNNVLFV